jgi:glycosyltransferase involved in cell wall biosynthesis
MVRVADLLRRKGINAHFLMLGSHGALMDHFVQLSASRDDLSVLTDVADVTDLLSSADVFFFPTLDEGFGIVATEAAACGLPVVVTDLPAVRESIPPANRSLMFPPDDDIAAAERLQTLICDPTRRFAASASARTWAEDHSPGRSIDTLLSIYQSSRQ